MEKLMKQFNKSFINNNNLVVHVVNIVEAEIKFC